MGTQGARYPVTYYPIATQKQFEINREAIRGKPYERYFDGDLWLHVDAMPAVRAEMPVEFALAHSPEGFNRLLEPGYLDGETGFCALPNGAAYVSSLVPFPGATADMFSWWFWWHAVEPARYTLWYPYNHISATPRSPEKLTRPGLSHTERYLGTTHRVVEYIGPTKVEVDIEFVDPADLGLDTTRFRRAGVVAHACARVWATRPRVKIATMLHLARRTDDGLELRSRYWIGDDIALRAFGRQLSVDALVDRTGLRERHAGASVAYEQLLHDQIEFTHLSTFLPDLYNEFGDAP